MNPYYDPRFWKKVRYNKKSNLFWQYYWSFRKKGFPRRLAKKKAAKRYRLIKKRGGFK